MENDLSERIYDEAIDNCHAVAYMYAQCSDRSLLRL